ncbi:MAG TPA: hypothetical protein VFU50_05755 [Terriglobales bacterium]|nr:hypothetical protein [Terriglobales bacterium]
MNSLWPKIESPEAAKSAMKNAASASFIIVAVTGTVAVLAIMLGHAILGIGGSALVDAGLFALIGWRLRKHSRIAAILGLLLYLLEAGQRFVSSAGSSATAGSVVTILFILYFINGVRGAMYLHQSSSPSPQPSGAPAK